MPYFAKLQLNIQITYIFLRSPAFSGRSQGLCRGSSENSSSIVDHSIFTFQLTIHLNNYNLSILFIYNNLDYVSMSNQKISKDYLRKVQS